MQTDAVWNDFLSCKQTLPTLKRDYREWHKGRKKFAVWTIGISHVRVQSRFDAARACLSEFLYTPYQRQPHVTLLVCGFLTPDPQRNDDYGIQGMERHVQDLRQAQIAPFEICIGGMNSFAAAPFLEVADAQGGLGRIRRILAGSHCEIRTKPYVPHLTIGLYAGACPARQVADRISGFQANTRISYLVNKITLSTYSAFEIAGPLFTEYEIALNPAGT